MYNTYDWDVCLYISCIIFFKSHLGQVEKNIYLGLCNLLKQYHLPAIPFFGNKPVQHEERARILSRDIMEKKMFCYFKKF